MAHVFKLNQNKGDQYTPSGIIKGSPTNTLNNQYTDKTGAFSSGTWTSTIGKWGPWKQESEEYCYIITGKAIITHKDGTSTTVKAGDSFVIPVGFEGYWETTEELSKFYCAYEVPKAKL
eukprot:TRINITY_DN4220_c0_g1_i1.p1 TRINITY_DN4220_c0_g1~~TRINITY_DN4220_c0_g1_i1.p1  ORF type:complete len:119 (-),score=19.57 TRINITY_DN4220_c0_g1_i1:144-500(-)